MPVPTSSYNPIIPQPTDLLSVSQGDVLDDFGAINTLVDMDHVDFAAPNNGGQHYRVTFFPTAAVSPVQTPPAPQTGSGGANTWNSGLLAGVVGLYSATNTYGIKNGTPVTNQTELWVNRTNASGVTQTPLTASILGTSAAPAASSSGWTMLPSGIMLAWGQQNGGGVGLALVTLPVSMPNKIITAQVSPFYSTGFSNQLPVTAQVAAITGNQTFTVYVYDFTASGGSTKPFNWLAIGY